MPLIEIKDFLSTKQFKEYLSTISAKDLIETWCESTPYEIFVNRYKFRLIENANVNAFFNKIGVETEALLNEYMYDLNTSKYNIGLGYNFKQFIELEKQFFTRQITSEYTEKQTNLIAEYLNFLNHNANKLTRIGILTNKHFHSASKISEKLNTINKASLLKMQLLNDQTTKLFKVLDGISEVFEKSFLEGTKEEVYLQRNFQFMDWEYFKAPFQLEGYPDATEEFLRAVIAWFKEQIYERKQILFWETTPNTYLIIEEFIVELQEQIGLTKTARELTTDNVKPQITFTESYPQFIFSSQEAYGFFCFLANNATTPLQLSFIFRQMSEIESPPMIVVKDKQFRDWYNKQPFEVKLESWTYTFINSKNADRIWCYNAVKRLIIKDS